MFTRKRKRKRSLFRGLIKGKNRPYRGGPRNGQTKGSIMETPDYAETLAILMLQARETGQTDALLYDCTTIIMQLGVTKALNEEYPVWYLETVMDRTKLRMLEDLRFLIAEKEAKPPEEV